jgi:hypothetical protein
MPNPDFIGPHELAAAYQRIDAETQMWWLEGMDRWSIPLCSEWGRA